MQESPAEIQTPMPRNLTGRSVTAPSPVLSPRSILSLLSPHWAFISARENLMRVSKIFLLQIILFILKFLILK
jgi:hypothetical protein